MKQITKNFKDTEFKCPDCGVIVYNFILVDRLQILRELIGEPITVTSGYRCSIHNKKVGGVSKSLHMEGLAADIKCSNSKLPELKRLAKLVFYNYGVGIYPNHVHVDIGEYSRFIGTY